MAGTRFTAWFPEDEIKALREIAADNHASVNYMLRIALRAFLFDAPIPNYIQRRHGGSRDKTTSAVR